MRVARKAFGVSIDSLPPDRAEEATVVENLLQRSTRMFMELGEEPTERMDVSMKAVRAAKHESMSVWCVEQLNELVWGKLPEVVRSAPVGDPPAKVLLMTIRRKSEETIVEI